MSEAAKSALTKAIEANGIAIAEAAQKASRTHADLAQAKTQAGMLQDTISSLVIDLAKKDSVVGALHAERAYLTTKLAEL